MKESQAQAPIKLTDDGHEQQQSKYMLEWQVQNNNKADRIVAGHLCAKGMRYMSRSTNTWGRAFLGCKNSRDEDVRRGERMAWRGVACSGSSLETCGENTELGRGEEEKASP